MAGLFSVDPRLRQEVAQVLAPVAAVLHLDPSGPVPCRAPVHLLLLDSLLLAAGRQAFGSGACGCPPILLLARRDGMEELQSFLTTVDDFVVWPCQRLELKARVSRLLEGAAAARALAVCGAVVVDRARYEATVAGRHLRLTPRELGLLWELARRCDRPAGRWELLEAVWGWDREHASNVVDVTVAGLRRKLAAQAGLIRTVRGVGYRLIASPEAQREAEPIGPLPPYAGSG